MSPLPPRRLLDDPSVDARLRNDLARARTHAAAYDVEAGLQTLTSTLEQVSAGGQVGAGSAASPQADAAWGGALRALRVKWWGWAAAGVASVGAVWWAQQTPSLQPAPRTQVERSAQVESAEAEPARVVAPASARQEPPVDGAAASAGQRVRAPASAALGRTPAQRTGVARSSVRSIESERAATAIEAAPSTTRESASGSESDPGTPRAGQAAPSAGAPQPDPAEVDHLAQVRRLLASAPKQALIAAREGQRRFARGLFVEERAGLIVFALERLGRTEEALHEGRLFLRAYPRGPFAARVHELVVRLEAQPR